MDASLSTSFFTKPSGSALRARARALEVHLVELAYDVAGYDDDLFQRHGIDFPSHLNRAVVRRRAEFLAGRVCAVRALELAGVRDAQVYAGADRCPRWPSGIAGSISHSERHAIAAVTAKSMVGVGIDIQPVDGTVAVEDLRATVFSGADWMLPLPAGVAEEQLAIAVFAIKECLFKAAYPTVRRFFDFACAEVLAIDWDLGHYDVALRVDLHPRLRALRIFRGTIDWNGGILRSLLVIDPN